MKDPSLWEADDLNQLIATQAEESSTLEFKRAQTLEDLANHELAEKRKEDISKDVSAFANRAGGVLIYGIAEEEQPPHHAKELSPVDLSKCSKERLDQIINSRIKPRIQGLIIRPITVRSSPIGVAYVVKIPRSHTAHQASDKRYYRRVNFGNDVMEDDEIRQAMNRQTKPTYWVHLDVHLTGINELPIFGTVQNTSAMIGHDVSAVLLVPKELSRYPDAWGTELIEDQLYIRMLNDHRARVRSELKPFETLDMSFERAAKIPDLIPALQVPIFVRVYNQFGEAHEAEVLISLHPQSPGQIVSERQRSRDASL